MSMSSTTHNSEFVDSDVVEGNPSSPDTILSDAYVAKLLSHTGKSAHSPTKMCDIKSPNHGKKDSICALENASELPLKDTTPTEDSLQMMLNEKSENPKNSNNSLLEDTSTLYSELEVSSTKCEDSPELNGSPNIESLGVINEKLIQEESNQVEHVNKKEKGETPSLLTMDAVEVFNKKNKPNYREGDSWTDDDDSASTFSLNSSSDCSDSFLEKMHNNVNTAVSSNKMMTIKTRGELDIDDLPPIEDLKIHINERDIKKIGVTFAIVDKLVVVQSLKDMVPLDLDSVLFLSSDKPLGRIFDVFGQVLEPFYSVRFNSGEDIKNSGIETGMDVFFAPEKEDFTAYVFVDELRKQKGSDASWKDNNEPPEECIDYSDDEQERAAKLKRRGKTRPKPFDDDDQSSERDHPESVTSNDSITTPSTSNAFRPTSSNTGMSNRISMAAVMTSAYRPNAPWSPNKNNPSKRFHGQPIITPVQPANSFRNATNLNKAASQMRMPNTRPHEVQFRSPQPFISQQNLVSALPMSLPYPPPSQPTFQFHQSPAPQPVRFQAFCPPQQVSFQQPHVFGQMTAFGSMSPGSQQPSLRFAPPVVRPPPFVSVPPASPNFSYFSHNHVSAPSPPTQGHIAPNSPWFQGQATNGPQPMRFIAPLSPLSIQIPNNLRTPPPTMPLPAVNGFSSIQSPPPFIQHPGAFRY